nr:phenol hydroxylase subunit [uncultured Rhodopila sp.]
MAAQQPPDTGEARRSANPDQAYVRVLGVRLGKYIEFEYSLGDGDLAVELILPFAAFEDFAKDRKAIRLPPADEVSVDLDRLAWRAGQPGLLRQPTK